MKHRTPHKADLYFLKLFLTFLCILPKPTHHVHRYTDYYITNIVQNPNSCPQATLAEIMRKSIEGSIPYVHCPIICGP